MTSYKINQKGYQIFGELNVYMNDHILKTHFKQFCLDSTKSYFIISTKNVEQLIRKAWLYGTYQHHLSNFEKMVIDYDHSSIVGRIGKNDRETKRIRVIVGYKSSQAAYLKTAYPC